MASPECVQHVGDDGACVWSECMHVGADGERVWYQPSPSLPFNYQLCVPLWCKICQLLSNQACVNTLL